MKKKETQSLNFIPSLIQESSFDFSKNGTQMKISDVFDERASSYINGLKLYVTLFNAIPQLRVEENMDCSKAIAWFIEKYKHKIKDFYFNKTCDAKYGTEEVVVYYLLEGSIIVGFLAENIRFIFRNTPIATIEKMIDDLKPFRFKKERATPTIELLMDVGVGIKPRSIEITKLKLNLDYNYNDDFKEIHQTIFKRLSKNNDKGLVLLHGKPGTGKTSYIRYLITKLKKNVIFLPPNMASSITDPNLISTLMNNQNSVLVIEDAENIIVSRDTHKGSPVSAILNITDGLLSDCLNIQIICSFNTDLSKIDSALMRKGRLIAKYEFKELEIEKAQRLSDKLGFKIEITEPMTLTEIYKQTEKEFNQSKTIAPIGYTGTMN